MHKVTCNLKILLFYDALTTNKSAVEIIGDETLKKIAKELVRKVHQYVQNCIKK